MATLRELKGRIGSVSSSKKITGAMKMISSAKMRKAEQSIRKLLPYRNQIETIISNLLSADAEFSSPLIEAREVNTVAIAVLGSDSGLCGAYNVNIFKQLLAHMDGLRQTLGHDVKFVLYPIGAKQVKACNKIAGGNISVVLREGLDSKSAAEEVKVFVEELRNGYVDGTFDRVDVLYMGFVSMSRQRMRADRFLPVTPDAFGKDAGAASARPYIFEPDVNTIFQTVLPLYLLAVMQEVFCENRASEQAARVMAMQTANDNAMKLLEQLQLEYNKLRQQSITSELLDIVGGQVR